MEKEKISEKIRSIKELVKTLERKTIEMITLTAELEYRYKNPLKSSNDSFKAELEMNQLEKELDHFMKRSKFINRNNTFITEK